jgi:exosortase D (VPLPA-CTERM-specific)
MVMNDKYEAAVDSGSPGPGGVVVWRPSLNVWLLLAIALLVSAWPFAGALSWLWDGWVSSEEYSHGLLLPVISAFLIWSRREQLSRIPFVGSWLGVGVVVLAGIVYWLGKMATLHVIDNFGYWLLLVGLALSLVGRRAFPLIAAPLAMLVLAIPVPQFFLNNLSVTLQLWSSELGAFFIRLMGISVFLQGNVIDLGSYKLEVAQACSGLRYLFPLITIGALLAYIYQGAWWKRLLIALSSVPLTVLMNGLRIGMIGLMVDRWGPALAEGAVHDFQGWATFMVTIALMVGLLMLLHPVGGERRTWRETFGLNAAAPVPAGAQLRATGIPRPFAAAVVAILAIAAVGQWGRAPVDTPPPRASLISFPDKIGDWVGHRSGMDEASLDVLQLSDYVLSNYVAPGGEVISVYVAYYDSQRTGTSVHSPRSCLPGGGWVMRDFRQVDLPGLAVNGQPLRVNRTLIELGQERQLVYYWFQQRGRIITSEFAVKWYLLLDGIVQHRTDGALIRFVTPLALGESAENADRRLLAMTRAVVPMLPEYVPN